MKLLIPMIGLFLVGVGSGVYLCSHRYAGVLDQQRLAHAQCQAARDQLTLLNNERERSIKAFNQAESLRKAKAEKAVGEAKISANADYAAANRLQQERTGGEQCTAAASIIDKELGL